MGKYLRIAGCRVSDGSMLPCCIHRQDLENNPETGEVEEREQLIADGLIFQTAYALYAKGKYIWVVKLRVASCFCL